ncbi:MAG: Uma2 family endonuclease [Phycisphaerae bacterium]|nr:Uma2 family endonuclease [Gemmatimonadaceae bacterium]
MPLQRTDWTVAMLNELPDDGNRYETIDGELFVTPAPSIVHQRAASQLFLLIAPYAERAGLDPYFAPTAITFSERREVQPDVLVLPRMPNGRRASRFEDVGSLLLAVEILSPSSLRSDRNEKRWLYQDEGVPMYWIVNIDARTIEQWTPATTHAELFTASLVWQPDVGREALTIDVGQYFRHVLDG